MPWLGMGTRSWSQGARWPWPPLPLPSDLDFLSLARAPFLPALVLAALQVSKTLKATLQALLELVASEDGDVLDSLQASPSTPSTESLRSTSSDPGTRQAGRKRGQQQETETFYIMVGRGQLGGTGGARGGPRAGIKTLGSSSGFPEAPGVPEWTKHPCQAAGQA